jgi:hypothetical protein
MFSHEQNKLLFIISEMKTLKGLKAMQYRMHEIYRVIHKSLRDFRTLQCNNQDRHSRKEHINRQRNSPSVQCVIMAYLRVLPLEGSCVEKWLLSTMGCCSVCGWNWITGLTSAASPGVDIWSTCKVGHTLGEFLYLLI